MSLLHILLCLIQLFYISTFDCSFTRPGSLHGLRNLSVAVWLIRSETEALGRQSPSAPAQHQQPLRRA